MAPANLDVIVLIIDNVDDRGTLFSLLTVSKEVFRHTCKILYRDPFRFFQGENLNDRLRGSPIKRLLQLLLALSPAVDDDANLVRSVLGVPLRHRSGAVDPVSTMLNYLSFVECVRWENRVCLDEDDFFEDEGLLDTAASASEFRSISSFVHATIARMIYHHRMGDIVELEIEVDAIDRFIDMVPHLRCLKYISIASFSHGVFLREEHYSAISRFVQAFQQHHGKDQLLDCRLAYRTRHTLSQVELQSRVAIAKLLPPLFPRNLKLTHPVRPMDGYLSRLETLETIRKNPVWGEISRNYSDMSSGQIFQRCRSLTSLKLAYIIEGKSDPWALAWAADEVRQRAKRSLFAPTVPLRDLVLELYRCPLATAQQILMDGLCGFSQSLETLHVTFCPPSGEEGGEEGNPSIAHKHTDKQVVMSNLTRLTIESTDPRLVDTLFSTKCTNLLTLVLHVNDCKESYELHCGWPEVHMPNLEYLRLEGRAIRLFDPASLRHMLRLKDMRLIEVGKDLVTSGEEWRLLDHWTWDWDLPELTRLHLEKISSSSAGFSFKVLRGCPKLSWVRVEFPEFSEQQPPYPIEVVSVLTDCTQDVFPNLKVLQLLGRFSLRAEDLEALIGRVLPDLRNLVLGSISPCTATQVVEFTIHHASLSYVRIRHPRLDKELCQAVYLEAIDPNDIDDGLEYFAPNVFEFQDSNMPGLFLFQRRH